jgi:predicted nucleic acid-binding protein
MKYLFDASSIFTAIREKKIRLLSGNYTLEIARYGLGNIVWKDHVLQHSISKEEAEKVVKAIRHTLALMEVLNAASNEEAIFEIATQLKITFYDASYAYMAKAKELQLITEDLRLTKKITPTIKALKINELEQENEKSARSQTLKD